MCEKFKKKFDEKKQENNDNSTEQVETIKDLKIGKYTDDDNKQTKKKKNAVDI